MVYIFYDTETSSRDLLGQILSYAFIVVNAQLEKIDELTGYIKLNRTQIPDIDAILVNKINIADLQHQGDPEYKAAEKIHTFLKNSIAKHGQAALVGFNSNSFDLSFLRNMFISYGLNPYFEGKLANIDALHIAKYIAFTHPELFPWTITQNEEGKSYYSFKLEHLAQAFDLLQEAQSHDAIEDVKLTLDLVKLFCDAFNFSLPSFNAVAWDNGPIPSGQWIAKQKVLDYSGQVPPQQWTHAIWTPLFNTPKATVLVDLEKYKTLDADEAFITCLKYINPKKHFLQLEPLSSEEEAFWEPTCAQLNNDKRRLDIKTPAHYFDLIKKDWDIAYQIHEMGFERIDTLRPLVQGLIKTPQNYPDMLRTLMDQKRHSGLQKDHYLLQLFNRCYFNVHPTPDSILFSKYLKARYQKGSLLKDKTGFKPFGDYLTELENRLNKAESIDKTCLESLHTYAQTFKPYFP
jgi:hypothetical protein